MSSLLYQQPTGGEIVTDTTENETQVTDHIAAIHAQLGDIAKILTDCHGYAKERLDSRFPDFSIPYYKLALQSQRQFCQTVKTLNDLTAQRNKNENKQKQDV